MSSLWRSESDPGSESDSGPVVHSRAPKIDLDLEEGVFRLLRSWWRRVAPKRIESAPDPSAAQLDDHRAAMRVLAQTIAGAPLRIQVARGVGGVRGLDLMLPASVSLAPDAETNRRILRVRTAISAALYHRSLDTRIPVREPLESIRIALDAVAWLEDVLPGFAEAYDEAVHWTLAARPATSTLEGRERILEGARQAALRGERPWLEHEWAEWVERLAGAPATRKRSPDSPAVLIWGEFVDHSGSDTNANAQPKSEMGEDERPPAAEASEFEAPPIDDVLRIELDQKEVEDAVLVHTFEKVETADAYAGGARDTDGADELADQLEALEEVDLREVMRGGEQAHSLLRSTISLDAEVPQVGELEPGEQGIAYDEWDIRKGAYRKQWCTVYPTRFGRVRPEWSVAAGARHRALITLLTRRLAVHRARLEPVDRQQDGEDIDLRAVVDERAARCAGRGGSTRLYTRRAKRRRDFATTVLIDVSLSSDAWVGGRRVLDVARDAAFVLGEVADHFGDRLQILAFASHTRNHCRVWEICGWQDPWPVGRARLGALEPQGYTRIGPALRHGTAELAAQSADARLLLLLSDGKPTDYDRYEGRYGIADVRHALREADRSGVSSHALAVDRVACDYLPSMFGPGGWHILPKPDALPEALSTIYGRVTGR